MKYTILLLLLLIFQLKLIGQNLQADLVLLGSSGSNLIYSPANWKVSFSIGELIVTPLEANYRAGFQQTYIKSNKPPVTPSKEDYNPVVTPNNDGYNDVFSIEPPIIEQVDFHVFDKWGTRVYIENNFDNSWEGIDNQGQSLDGGVYVYLIIDKQRITIYKGTITLYR
jgi:gliding motility-associated-like protein